MSKNDDRILELKKLIKEKKKELCANKVKFVPETNCSLDLDGTRHNLNVCTNDMLTMLLIKLHTYVIAAEDLKVSVPELSGYSIDKWMTDIRSKLEVIRFKEEEKKLKEKEDLLEKLLSEDKKTELMLDEIAEMLKEV